MESDPEPRKAPSRQERKLKIMGVIAKNGAIAPTELLNSVYISDADLGEILTGMLRDGDIRYLFPPGGKSKVMLTPDGMAKYARLAAAQTPKG